MHLRLRTEGLGRPGAERGAALLRHAQQFRDDLDGKRAGERPDEIGGAQRRHRVGEALGDLRDARPQRLDPGPGERGRDQTAQPGVVGRVGVEHVGTQTGLRPMSGESDRFEGLGG
ncbi:hypothetical protein ACFQ51_32650 [Streptomyces kaempferi]